MGTASDQKAQAAVAEASLRPVWAEIDLDAVRHNAGVMKRLIEPAALCAVVKADAYGHGAVAVARAAIEGGATWLGVAVVEEGIELRQAGIAAPVLVLSEPPPEAMAEAVSNGLIPTVYTRAGIAAAESAAASAAAAAAASASAESESEELESAELESAGSASAGSASAGSESRKVDVHLKVDTGMHRVGADPDRDGGARDGGLRIAPSASRSGLDAPGGRRGAQRRGPGIHLGADPAIRRGSRSACGRGDRRAHASRSQLRRCHRPPRRRATTW